MPPVPEVPPVAGFHTTGYLFQGKSIQFINTSQHGTSYTWDFGDGLTAGKAHPTHKYDKAGIFLVQLTVKNTAGTQTITQKIHVRDNLENVAGDYIAEGVRDDWGGWASNKYYPVGVFTFNISIVNDTTLKVFGWEVLKRPSNGDTSRFSFADKINYLNMGSHTGAYFTYYTATDSIYCLIKNESLGGGTQWTYHGKKL
ncbi:MAG TPA: PKD domain-containing protein [Saprospiraceae bacterium]|nr:PKD domain-containing protein [Saprospiraceae bacterium]